MSQLTGYSGTPLPVKLGIRPESRVLVVAAPDGFDPGPLPPGVRPHSRPSAAVRYDVIIAFCPDLASMKRRFGGLAGRLVGNGALWICWPKKASGVPTDLTENVVREVGLAGGLVDVKVAAVDRV